MRLKTLSIGILGFSLLLSGIVVLGVVSDLEPRSGPPNVPADTTPTPSQTQRPAGFPPGSTIVGPDFKPSGRGFEPWQTAIRSEDIRSSHYRCIYSDLSREPRIGDTFAEVMKGWCYPYTVNTTITASGVSE